MRPILRRSVALAAACLLLAAACSDDSSGSSDGGGDGDGGGNGAVQGPPAPEGIDGVLAIGAPGDRDHLVGNIDYPINPPIGGDHNEVWANCKFYDDAVPDENVVHSLEHGAVWVAYGSDAPADELDLLSQRSGDESHLIATPYEGLSTTYVLTAWERRLELESLGDPRFEQFLAAYLQGPTTPETDTACSGGAG